ncbi:DsbA family protein [Lolliginicoccus suaedae]|uniref:DsbA family protein n=1 Tax=Lolliginicoccus suaedae TaxID=2605429 RepID=UPI0011ED65EA|nr:DsbA family protein [Lolliginicoccus suaedae]
MTVHAEAGTVVVYSDVACPWATLALHRFYQWRSKAGLDGALLVDFRLFSLEEASGQPLSKSLAEATIPVAGACAPELAWHMWQGGESTWPTTSLLANEAVHAAALQSAAAAEELDRELRRALFRDSRNISLRAEILRAADRCEHVNGELLGNHLDSGTAREAMIDGFRNRPEEVVGSPHFFLPDGSDAFNPGVEFHWEGEPGEGFPVIDRDDPQRLEDLIDGAVVGSSQSQGGRATR